MAYKDKDKQREADKERQRRHRLKGVTQGRPIPKEGVTNQGVTEVVEDIGVRDEVLEAEGLKPKRGKDIKCFEDLPPDVQNTIRRISESNEEFQRRTGIAIRYQHIFPNRFHSTGVAI